MLSELDATERDRVTKVMRTLLVSNALHHLEGGSFGPGGAFSALALERYGLISTSGPKASSTDLAAVLTTPDHARRITHAPGPLLFLMEDASRRSVLYPSDLLASRDPELRLGAAQYFDQLPEGVIARRTRRVLIDTRQELASSDDSRWIPAGRTANQLLRNDIYLGLAGFNQSYELGYKTGVDEYLTALLRPDAALLASIELDVWDPIDELDVAEKNVSRAAEADTLDQVMNDYYRNFGHLPLTGSLGAAAVVSAWIARGAERDLWSELWAWADKRKSPVPRYHAAAACLANPGIVPKGLEAALWGEVAEVVRGTLTPPKETRWAEAWQLREELAHHLGQHLPCVTPGFPSERVFGIAWWLAERITEALPASPGILREIRLSTIADQSNRSSYISTLTHPPVGRSGLRYLTLHTGRVWSTAMVCELAHSSWLSDRCQPVPDDRLRIEDAALRTLVQAFPPPNGNTPPVFGFDHSIEPLISAWIGSAAGEEDKRTGFNELLRVGHLLSATDGLTQMIEALVSEDARAHLRLAHALRMRAYTIGSTGAALKDTFASSSLWKRLLANSDESVLSHIFEAFIETAVQDGDPWRSTVPHLFASAAEDAATDEHRKTLFTLTLFTCLGTGAVGALDRLMHGDRRSEFVPFAAQWRDQFLSVLSDAPPWAGGRIRAALPALNVDELPAEDES